MTDIKIAGQVISKKLPYRPPYEWDKLLTFFEGRAIDGVEMVRDQAYWRVIRESVDGREWIGWIAVAHEPEGDQLRLILPDQLHPILPLVEEKISHMFDLNCNPHEIYDRLRTMNEIKAGLCIPGTRVPGTYDAFEMCVRAVLGQQITVKAARTLASRLALNLGEPVETGIEGLTHAFPTAESVLNFGEDLPNTLGSLGVTGQRSQTIRSLAGITIRGLLQPQSPAAAQEVMKELMTIKGVGPWTAHYLAMRALKWSDAFPSTDYGVKKVLEPRSQKEIQALSEAWRPWRAYATVNIWNWR